MKKIVLFTLFFAGAASVSAQQKRYLSVGFFSTQTDYPFGKFTGLVSPVLHPGVEFGYGRAIAAKTKHEWLFDIRVAYFFHRFVQHGIPVTANFGYRRHFRRFSAESSIGAGYMHSIPATGKHKLDENGEYRNDKGPGRMQGTANFDIGASFRLAKKSTNPLSVFILYEQRLQFPFVRSYVPLLPYNALQVGLRKPLPFQPKNK